MWRETRTFVSAISICNAGRMSLSRTPTRPFNPEIGAVIDPDLRAVNQRHGGRCGFHLTEEEFVQFTLWDHLAL